MKKVHFVAGALIAAGAIAGATALGAFSSSNTAAGPAPPLPTQVAASTCHLRGPLPDAACTPGATNPAVTQDNISITICKSGWTATIRPPASYTTKLKLQQMVEYGITGNKADYEEDHLISLELGGNPTDPHNLWPEPWGSKGTGGAHDKDVVETALKKDVCAGTLPLIEAQQRIATDWTKALP